MRLLKITSAALLMASLPAMAASHPKKPARTSSSIKHSAPAVSSRKTAAAHHEAAPGMDPARAAQIQSALIKAGYMTGEPSGQWDAESTAAMAKFQADNDWQTKFTPDARALNKLGLGGPTTGDGQ